jgi:hypothetical protein
MHVTEDESNNELDNSIIKMEERLNNTQSTGKPYKVPSEVQNRSRISHIKSVNASSEVPTGNLSGVQQPTFYAERLKSLRDKIQTI